MRLKVFFYHAVRSPCACVLSLSVACSINSYHSVFTSLTLCCLSLSLSLCSLWFSRLTPNNISGLIFTYLFIFWTIDLNFTRLPGVRSASFSPWLNVERSLHACGRCWTWSECGECKNFSLYWFDGLPGKMLISDVAIHPGLTEFPKHGNF